MIILFKALDTFYHMTMYVSMGGNKLYSKIAINDSHMKMIYPVARIYGKIAYGFCHR